MFRHLYRCFLRLHPRSFRERFGEEMLYIFDQQRGLLTAFGLLLDSFLSLLRQWTFRSRLGIAITSRPNIETTSNGGPSFATINNFRPRMSAIVHGLLLSTLLFCMSVYAIRYSWIHVINVGALESVFHPNQRISTSTSPNYSSSSSAEAAPFDSKKSRFISETMQVDVIPVEGESTARIETTSRNSHHSAVPTPVLIQFQLEPYVGNYLSRSPRLKISIGIDGDHLSVIVAGHPQRALTPVSQRKFVIAGAKNSSIEFTPDDDGTIDSLCLTEENSMIVAHRQ